MKKIAMTTALAFFTLSLPADAATYIISRSINSGTATGTITTDGMLGILTSLNIISFNITVDYAGNSDIISKENGYVQIVGNDFTAANDGIYFNFGGSLGSRAFFSSDNNVTDYCLQVSSCVSKPPGEFLRSINAQNTFAAELGNIRIAELVGAAPAVPEAETWVMMIFGLGAVGFALRRQRLTTRTSWGGLL